MCTSRCRANPKPYDDVNNDDDDEFYDDDVDDDDDMFTLIIAPVRALRSARHPLALFPTRIEIY